MPWISIKAPIRIISEANNTDHWTKKRKRNKRNQALLGYMLNSVQKPPYFPVKVTLTRIAPRNLDNDNLAYSFKNLRDFISDWLLPGRAPGRADSDARLSFCYDQQKGEPKEYAVLITLTLDTQ